MKTGERWAGWVLAVRWNMLLDAATALSAIKLLNEAKRLAFALVRLLAMREDELMDDDMVARRPLIPLGVN